MLLATPPPPKKQTKGNENYSKHISALEFSQFISANLGCFIVLRVKKGG